MRTMMKEEKYMYHYIEDKAFIKRAKSLCSTLLTELTQKLLAEDISSQFFLVGSSSRNMVTQNESQPIDFDYNINVQKCMDINDCRCIKETIRKAFNIVLKENGLFDCEDSTSSLTTKSIYFSEQPFQKFSIDICIVVEDNHDYWYRLVHNKTGWVANDTYHWDKYPNSNKVKIKSEKIKKAGKWEKVREEYLNIKNSYLKINANNHPSFICYIEAINNVYNSLRQQRII